MSKITTYSKAEKVLLKIRNEKVDKLNAFYNYHKEVIDDYNALQKEVSDADGAFYKARINSIQYHFPLKRKNK